MIMCSLIVLLLISLLPTKSGGAFASSKSTNNEKITISQEILDLQSQHPILKDPNEIMNSIADSCDVLGIDKFDVYGDYSDDESTSYLRRFEAEVAKHFGKEDAVFMPSGTMAQNIALLIHSGKEHIHLDHSKSNENYKMRFACHHTSHLLLWEEQSYSKLVGMEAVEIETKSDAVDGLRAPPLSLCHVDSVFKKEKERYNQESGHLGDTGLSTLIIELPHRELGGKLPSWNDVVSIGELCKKENIKYHCDGARIFEASAGYGKSVSDLAEPFDSIYISFYKGLGSISGAMLMGKKDFCDEARVWLTRFGGNLYTLLPYAASCWRGYRRHALGEGSTMTFANKFDKLKRVTEMIKTETVLSDIGAFDPCTPETNMVRVYLKRSVDQCESARDGVVQSCGMKVFSRIRSVEAPGLGYSEGFRAMFEWTMGEANGAIDDEKFIHAWKEFCSRLECM
mmetsp:Transcript_8264/g.10484  ORF Transcript_8264/g.10484 Transcript_8264/m.10484 type:complete len:454 (-) Transcript_8264:390-1751(-)